MEPKCKIGAQTYYLLGAPSSETGRRSFKVAVLARMNRDEGRTHDYLLRINDRIINKARGMVSFNGILAAIAGLLLGVSTGWVRIAFLLAVASAIVNLAAFFVIWEAEEEGHYRTAEDEIDSTIFHNSWRAIALNVSIVMSLLACLILMGVIIFCV